MTHLGLPHPAVVPSALFHLKMKLKLKRRATTETALN
jgi:hypothetical protein